MSKPEIEEQIELTRELGSSIIEDIKDLKDTKGKLIRKIAEIDEQIELKESRLGSNLKLHNKLRAENKQEPLEKF